MSMDQDWIGLRKSVLFYFCVVTSVLTSSNTSITNSSSFSTPSIMTTEQQTSTTVSLTTATTQAPVTTVPSDTPVNGSETSLGMDTMPSNSPSHAHSSATLLGFLVPVSATDQEPSGDAALQTNSTNVLGAQSSAFSVSNLSLLSPDSQLLQWNSCRLYLCGFSRRPRTSLRGQAQASVSHNTSRFHRQHVKISRHLRLTQLIIWLTPPCNRVPHFSRHIILQLIVPLKGVRKGAFWG